MDSSDAPIVPIGSGGDSSSNPAENVAVQRTWRKASSLSSIPAALCDQAEHFLSTAGFDRAPWIAAIFAGGILSWFALATSAQWTIAIGAALLLAIFGAAVFRGAETRVLLRQSTIILGLVFAAGIATIWIRSEFVGAEPIERPTVERIQGYVLEREDQPARDRIRLVLAIRDVEQGESRKIRVNVPLDQVQPNISEGSVLRMRVRMMPPASPMLPGAYDFARTAWFQGLSATGSVIGEIEIIEHAAETSDAGAIARLQRWLSQHVSERVEGSAGTIAAAFASGDRGGIAEADDNAMRDAGLTHLLSISGLHVSAVIAAAYIVVLKLLALFPAIALRVRLPVMAASFGAIAGIGYTLLTGAEVPTVRSCVAAMLVLVALAMGRDALSLRMVAVAAIFVMLLWPESVAGPSFQMSFSAVLAIVALHTSTPVRSFLAPREESWIRHGGRRVFMLFVTGLVIEIALMPIVLFHFHRAGLYGALANVAAIPLVTFISMPLIALALLLDLFGLGAPAWWLVQASLDLLLGIAHWTSAQPGSVKLMPQMTQATIALFVVGALWLALWNSRARLLGFVPAAIATAMLLATPIPDVLIGRDGRHVGVTIEGERLLSLRDSRSSYARDNLLELASVASDPIPMANWPNARCSTEFCLLELDRGGRQWTLLMARNRDLIEERSLAAACDRADIVVADRYLPRSCNPKWLKADKGYLDTNGGISINLVDQTITTVASGQGDHGWWRGAQD
ncbi:MAG: ComEC/Rec2 family competence protein [Erythrobacter sp.]